MSDLIDRKTVFDVIDKCILEKLEGDTVEIKEPLKLIMEIYRIPSAQPQRMKGRWIHDGYDNPHGVDWMHCSVCGRREPHVPAAMTNFCPSCGADMDGENDA